MAAENKQLRAARQRTASLTSPDVCLSRQELAELVNTWVWDHHEKMVEHSANWVGQLETGKIRWPGKVSREALRAILGVSTCAALGFVNARSARGVVRLENVDRQQFLHTTGARGLFRFALACAEQADDWHLRPMSWTVWRCRRFGPVSPTKGSP